MLFAALAHTRVGMGRLLRQPGLGPYGGIVYMGHPPND